MINCGTEESTFTEHGSTVGPVGLAHTVDPESPLNSAGGVLAYVRVIARMIASVGGAVVA